MDQDFSRYPLERHIRSFIYSFDAKSLSVILQIAFAQIEHDSGFLKCQDILYIRLFLN